ncbi:hypothetical protein J2TS4_33610 [Paenibacillus sp. J2TS4]|nr:hypothetical protein J2TS4_33610 [Paenibacillus sp. J2TS4]
MIGGAKESCRSIPRERASEASQALGAKEYNAKACPESIILYPLNFTIIIDIDNIIIYCTESERLAIFTDTPDGKAHEGREPALRHGMQVRSDRAPFEP